jgi:Conserved TM helix
MRVEGANRRVMRFGTMAESGTRFISSVCLRADAPLEKGKLFLMVQNWGQAILNALSNALNLVLTFIPRLFGFLVILLVGWIIAILLSKALTLLLRKVGFDRMSERIGLTRFEQRMGVKMDSAGILGKIVYWFILLIFLVPAADALGVPAVSNILNQLVGYIPDVFVAILVLFLGALAGTVVADLVRGATASAKIGNPNLFANLARFAIIGFAALIALEQLQIAPALLNELFGAFVAAVAIAFGLAFGLGGQETARKWLNRGESTMSDAASQLQAQQQQAQVTQAQRPSTDGHTSTYAERMRQPR